MSTRNYDRNAVAHFRFTNEPFGELSNFWPLISPIHAGPWRFSTSEALYQAAKFPENPELQERIACTTNAYAAKQLARSVPIASQRQWNARRVDVMRWVLRAKHRANRSRIDDVLLATADRPIVEFSTRDAFWGARPQGDHLNGTNALGRLWMEIRQQLQEENPLALPDHALQQVRESLGRLAEPLPEKS